MYCPQISQICADYEEIFAPSRLCVRIKSHIPSMNFEFTDSARFLKWDKSEKRIEFQANPFEFRVISRCFAVVYLPPVLAL